MSQRQPRQPTLNTPPPERVDQPAIKQAIAAYRDLVDKLGQADPQAARAERAVLSAEDADREALAGSIQTGKRDPGTAKLDKATGERDAAVRRVEALELAVANAHQALTDALVDAGEGWATTLEQQAAEQRVRLGETLDRLAIEHSELQATLALAGWAAGNRLGRTERFNPAAYASTLRSLQAVNGDPLPVYNALGALRGLVDTQEPTAAVESEGEESARSIRESVERMRREAARRGVPVGALTGVPVSQYDER